MATLARALKLAQRPSTPLVTTGLAEVDGVLKGVLPGQVWLVVGGPRQGRTSWAAHLAARAATVMGAATTALAGVDGAEMMAVRIIAAACNVSLARAQAVDPWPLELQPRLDAALAAPIEIERRWSTTLESELTAQSSRRLLVVDDLDLWASDPVADAARIKEWAAASGGGALLTAPLGVASPASSEWQTWVRAVDAIIRVHAPVGERLGEVDLTAEHHRYGPTVRAVAAGMWSRSRIDPLRGMHSDRDALLSLSDLVADAAVLFSEEEH